MLADILAMMVKLYPYNPASKYGECIAAVLGNATAWLQGGVPIMLQSCCTKCQPNKAITILFCFIYQLTKAFYLYRNTKVCY